MKMFANTYRLNTILSDPTLIIFIGFLLYRFLDLDKIFRIMQKLPKPSDCQRTIEVKKRILV